MSDHKEQWGRLLAPYRITRQGKMLAGLDVVRNPFVQDYDRIIFSSSFRRLAKKTQVHPLVRNDHIHNRLTHSLEVSCVGRSLALLAGQGLAEGGVIQHALAQDGHQVHAQHGMGAIGDVDGGRRLGQRVMVPAARQVQQVAGPQRDLRAQPDRYAAPS